MTSSTPIQIGTPAAHRKPSTAHASPAIDSTERSISPAMITSVIGRAMIATSMRAASRLAKLRGDRNTGDRREPMKISAIRTTSRSVSQRTSERAIRAEAWPGCARGRGHRSRLTAVSRWTRRAMSASAPTATRMTTP